MIWVDYVPIFLLVLVRMSAFFFAAPVFSTRGIPASFKIGLAFFLSLITVFAVGITTESAGELVFNGTYILLLLKEFFVGLSLGFVAAMLLYAVQVAGGFIDMQIGFAIANVIDPQTGMHSPITGNFKFIFALLFLLSVNGHHLLIEGVIASYRAIPIDFMLWYEVDPGRVAQYMVHVFLLMFTSAFMMAAPIIGSIFLVDVALGIIARTVPQMNMFVVGLPIKIFTSFVMMLVVLPGFFYLLRNLFDDMYRSMGQLMRILGGA